MVGNVRGPANTFTPAMGELICDRLSAGESLLSICREPGMPSDATVRKWTEQFPDFYAEYTRARMRQMDVFADQVVEISDNPSGDVNRDKLRLDARKWLTSKIAPKRFGDRVAVTGPDDGPLRVESNDASSLATALLGVLAKAGADPKKEE